MRLDEFLCERGYFDSRTKAKQAIERGEIIVNGTKVFKPAFLVSDNVVIERKFKEEYVSLGGFKLAKALKDFDFSVENICVADIGASTGGFTDCLIKNGARKVFAVDLNDGLLHEKLRKDDRVVSIIKNAKDLERGDFSEKIDLIVADLSFISATLVLPVFYNLLDADGTAILLIKPQFENGERQRFKNGIIRDVKVRMRAVKKIFDCAVETGFSPVKITVAPENKDKNTEYLLLLDKTKRQAVTFESFSVNIF